MTPFQTIGHSLTFSPVGYSSGQRGQTVNLLANAFEGSNPSPTTIAVYSGHILNSSFRTHGLCTIGISNLTGGELTSGDYVQSDFNPRDVFDDIVCDPRMNEHLYRVYESYFRQHQFQGDISLSKLYRPPENLIIKIQDM